MVEVNFENVPNYPRDVQHLLDVRPEPFAVRGLIVPGRLRVGIVRRSRFLATAFGQWLHIAARFNRPQPSFDRAAIGRFRPRDPVLVIYYEGSVEALMQLRDGHIVVCPEGKRDRLVYVSFLEVAPWNQQTTEGRSFRGLGPLLLRFAVQRSAQLGFGGVIGLHALRRAEEFYRRLGFGTLDCPNEYRELYFELAAVAAQRFLQEGGA